LARYVDPKGKTFWEIERAGATVVQHSGKVGSAGRKQTKRYPSPFVALFESRKLVADKKRQKYMLVDAKAPDEFPFESDERLVHGDILQHRGDPLGELIVMQHRGVDTRELLAAHAQTWFGDLVDVLDQFRFTWRLGRLSRVEVRPDARLDPHMPGIPFPYKVSVLIHALFELPIASAVEDLVVGSHETNEHSASVTAVSVCAPQRLRRLEIVAKQHTRGGGLWSMRLPTLEEFDCGVELDTRSLEFVADAACPKLHTLSIRIHGAEEGLFLLPTEVRDEMRALKRILAILKSAAPAKPKAKKGGRP
jgi:predicted DNA-binding WGR domain protein